MNKLFCAFARHLSLALFLAAVSAASNAQTPTSSEVSRGVQWLASQVQTDGSLINEASSIATVFQARSETAHTLKLLSTMPPALEEAIGENLDGSTEHLARKMLVRGLNGFYNPDDLDQLLQHQNLDGGFGGGDGHASNALDTAWALLALAKVGKAEQSAKALAYLQAVQSPDGAFSVDGRPASYTTAVVLNALQAYASQHPIEGVLQQTTDYLQSLQSASVLPQAEVYLNALVYASLHDFVPSEPAASEIRAYLISHQEPDGSWGNGDPYVTALALRALHLTTVVPANPTKAVIKGKVVDAQTLLALPHVVVSGNGLAAETNNTGHFEFRDVNPGDYQLSLVLDQYQELTASLSVKAGQVADFGTVQMTKGAGMTTGTILGTVKDGATGGPLGGVSILLNGEAVAVTDDAGTYQIANVAPGPVNLQAIKEGYGSAGGAGNVVGGSVLLFSPMLTLTPSSNPPEKAVIQGTVIGGGDGMPLPGVSISVTGAATANAVTNAQGYYSIADLNPGKIQVSASLAGYDTVVANGTAMAGTVIEFSPKLYAVDTSPPDENKAAVQGAVLDAGTNTPLAGAQVVALIAGEPDRSMTTDASGAFHFAGISAASVTLSASMLGYATSTFEMPLQPLQTLDMGQIRLRKEDVTLLLPDLGVSAVSRRHTATDPQSLVLSGNLTATIVNSGTASANGEVEVLAFYDRNGNGSYESAIDLTLGSTIFTAGLMAGESVDVAVPVSGVLPFRDAPLHVRIGGAQGVIESDGSNNVATTSVACEFKPELGTLQPKLKWAWTGSETMPLHRQVISTPLVLPLEDTNGDGKIDQHDIPAIVFNTYNGAIYLTDGVLRAISGKDGRELWTVTNPAHRTIPVGTLSAADIDGDGMVEIIAARVGGGVLVFEHTGALKWQTSVPANINRGGAAIADLDGNGVPEIVIGNAVLNANGSLRWQGSGYRGDNGFGPLSIVADINLDGKPEVVAGAAAYSNTGQRIWRNTSVGDGFVAVANFNDDPYPEIAIVANGRVFLLNYQGAIIWGPVSLPGGGRGGAPTIADFDGDGKLDIGVAGGSRYVAIRGDGSILWSSPTQDLSSNVTGSSVFDFDGDGKAEVVYADEHWLRMYRGSDGTVLFAVPNTSGTTYEMPVIADVDNDNHADIVVCINDVNWGTYGSGIRVYQDANNSWVNTRKIWNQHSYHITNINDDGTVPAVEQNSWQVHNTYRLNTQPGQSATAVPDLTASYLRIQDRGGVAASTFTVRVGNAGALHTNPGLTVAFYNGAPQAGGTLLGTASTASTLAPGQYEDLNFDYPNALSGIAELVAVVDDNGTGQGIVHECDESNNHISLTLSALPGSFALAVGTDQPGYGADSNVLITAPVSNHGSFTGSVDLRFVIQAAHGETAAILPVQRISIAQGAQHTVNAVWNSGTTLAGPYRVLAQLLDANGAAFAEAASPFAITGDTSGLNASIATDKQSYLPTDVVQIHDRLANIALNAVQENLQLVTTVRNPDGTIRFTATETLAQLPQGALKNYGYSLPLNVAAAGQYQATLSVTKTDDTVLAQAQTHFTVGSTADSGSGLSGVITASPKEVPMGEAVVLDFSVANAGNAVLTKLPLTVRIIDPEAQSVLAEFPYHATLAAGEDYTAATSWQVEGEVGRSYVAVLAATIGANTLTLAQDHFKLIAPPVKLDISQASVNPSRVLVLVSCKDGPLLVPAGNGGPCITERAQTIDQVLTELGVPHTIVTDEDAFRHALRSGIHNTIWISGKEDKLHGALAGEVREAVFGGNGFLSDSMHDQRNKVLDEAAGITYRGKIGPTGLDVDITGPLFEARRLPTVERGLRLEPNGSIAQASFVGKKEETAILSHAYGHGRAITFAFDLAGSLRSEPQWKEILAASLQHVAPAHPSVLTPGALLTVHTGIANLAKAVDLIVTATLPQGAAYVGSSPTGVYDAGQGTLAWAFALAEEQERDLFLTLRTPAQAGDYLLRTDVATHRNSAIRPYGDPLTLSFTVTSASDAVAHARQQLADLLLTRKKDQQLRDGLVAELQQAMTLFDQDTASAYAAAIDVLVQIADGLASLQADTAAIRRDIGLILKEAQWRWTDAQ